MKVEEKDKDAEKDLSHNPTTWRLIEQMFVFQLLIYTDIAAQSAVMKYHPLVDAFWIAGNAGDYIYKGRDGESDRFVHLISREKPLED